jgi:hypothetical protein
MSRKIADPLLVVCQHPECGCSFPVKSRWLQRIRKYCSLSCGAIMRNRAPGAFEASSRGAKLRTAQERARLMAEVKDMEPIEAFRLGYLRGLYSKHRQVQRYRRKVAA